VAGGTYGPQYQQNSERQLDVFLILACYLNGMHTIASGVKEAMCLLAESDVRLALFERMKVWEPPDFGMFIPPAAQSDEWNLTPIGSLLMTSSVIRQGTSNNGLCDSYYKLQRRRHSIRSHPMFNKIPTRLTPRGLQLF